MSVLVYAISRDDARAPAAGELQEICAAGLRALAEPVEEPLSAGLEQLVRYEEKVETVMQSHTILPMRFGNVVDEDEVRELLKANARELMAAISHLDGAVEFGVNASPRRSPPAADGAAPLTMRAADGAAPHTMRAAGAELRAWLDSSLQDFVREGVYRRTPISGAGSISAAYLVDREAQDRFVDRMKQLACHPGRTLSWSGPWPPYTFVEGMDT